MGADAAPGSVASVEDPLDASAVDHPAPDGEARTDLDVQADDDLDGELDDDLDVDDLDDENQDDELDDDADDLEDHGDDLDVENDDLDDDDDEVDAPAAAPVSGRRAKAAAAREAEKKAAEKKSPPNKKDAARPGTKAARKSAPAQKSGSPKAAPSASGRRGLVRFLREVIAELGKVIWPGRRELIVYTSVVIVFMAFMVALVAGLDILFAQGVLAVFG